MSADHVAALLLQLLAEDADPSELWLPTGLRALDRLVGGLRRGRLTVVTSRPGVGRSVVATTFARTAAVDHDVPTLLAVDVQDRDDRLWGLLAQPAALDVRRLVTGDVDVAERDRVVAASSRLSDAPLHLVATREPDVLLDVVDSHAAAHGGLVVLDVDPTARPDPGALVRVAHDHDVAVVVTDPARPGVDERVPPVPRAGDLRTPDLADRCHLLLALHRDELLDPDSPDRGLIEVHVAKHRNGPTGLVPAAFIGHRHAVVNLVGTR